MTGHHDDGRSNVEAALLRQALELARRDKELAARLVGIAETELESRMRGSGLDDSPGQ